MIGTLAVLLDCWVIYRSGRVALADGYESPSAADAANRMITVPFFLVLFGAVALLSIVDVSNDPLTAVVTRLGLLALVLAAAHGIATALIGSLRERKRQELRSEYNAMTKQGRRPAPRVAPVQRPDAAPPEQQPVPRPEDQR